MLKNLESREGLFLFTKTDFKKSFPFRRKIDRMFQVRGPLTTAVPD